MGNINFRGIVLLCFCFFIISGAEKTPSTSNKIKWSTDQQDKEPVLFPSFIQRDAAGNIPVVNPTTPGTTPIVNPTSPIPPTTTGPNPTTGPSPTSSGGSWCIANPSASQTALQVALDYACGYGGTDCSAIQPNAPCWDPNTVIDHASYAFNDYYQKNPVPTSCVFGGTAQLTNTDPSHGNCRFTAATTTTPAMPPPSTPMAEPPPSPTMATNPYGGGGDTEPTDGDYGAEPTGEPSSASTNLALRIVTVCCLILPLAVV